MKPIWRLRNCARAFSLRRNTSCPLMKTGPKGETGPRGPQGLQGVRGEPGKGLTISGYYATAQALAAAVTNPTAGDAYGVGAAEPYDIYIYDGVMSACKLIVYHNIVVVFAPDSDFCYQFYLSPA